MKKIFLFLGIIFLFVQPVQSEEIMEKAIFAGGCFWCVESAFDGLPGVKEAVSGYTGGKTQNPTYEEVSTGRTGHCEAVQVIYDPKLISYEQLLDVFWHNVDPTDIGGQFVDRGSQYRPEIFYFNEEQKKQAEDSRMKLEASGVFGAPIVVPITPASDFYQAEEHHQNFCLLSGPHYKFYRLGSGRDQYLDKIWGKDRKKSH